MSGNGAIHHETSRTSYQQRSRVRRRPIPLHQLLDDTRTQIQEIRSLRNEMRRLSSHQSLLSLSPRVNRHLEHGPETFRTTSRLFNNQRYVRFGSPTVSYFSSTVGIQPVIFSSNHAAHEIESAVVNSSSNADIGRVVAFNRSSRHSNFRRTT